MSTKQFQSAPLYVQLRTALAHRIAAGDWKPGETIPNESDLAKEYGLSAGTVRKALDWMEEAKLISRQQGRGTFVTDPGSKELILRFNRVRDRSGAMPAMSVEILSSTRALANSNEQKRLSLRADDLVIRITKMVHTSSAPLMLKHSSLSAHSFPNFAASIATAGPPIEKYDLLEVARRDGLLIGKGEEHITVASAEGEIAEQLKVPPGSILMRFDRIVYTIDEQPAEWRRAWCNLRDYEYVAELS